MSLSNTIPVRPREPDHTLADRIGEVSAKANSLVTAVTSVVRGRDEVVRLITASLLAGGHFCSKTCPAAARP